MRKINRRQALAWLATTLAGSVTGGCSGGGGESDDPSAPFPDHPSDLPGNSAPALRSTDYLGSLYQSFEWSGSIRDPFRDEVEIIDPALAQPMTADALLLVEETLQQRDIIMQIGGMGSAKLNPDPGQINAQFKTYMDAIVADNAVSWRNAVTARASEIALVTPAESRVYWQIGNEINASSYQRNIDLYLGRSSTSLNDIIPIYVEYFLAPTAQAMRQAASQTGKPVRLALGSIAGFANANSQLFLDTLLNYTVTGTFAAELAGTKVHSLVELVALHYLMGASTPAQPEIWRDVLLASRQKWMGVGTIAGFWSTEEVGIRAVDEGKGAGGALRIMSRYLGWVSENRDEGRQTRWFFFDTNAGPINQRINDALTLWHQWTGGNTLQMHAKLHSAGNTLETYAFQLAGAAGWLLTVTAIGETPVSLSDIPIDLPGVNRNQATVQARLFAANGSIDVNASLLASTTGAQLRLVSPVNLMEPDTLLLLVSV